MAISQENTINYEVSSHDNLATTINSDDYTSAVGAQASHTEGGWTGPLTGTTYGGTDVVDTASGQAGIVDQFKEELHKAISDTYITQIKNYIDQVGTNCEDLIHPAFSGTEIEKSVANLIDALKNEVNAYAVALETAEKEIVTAVETAYVTHDTTVASQMAADTAKLDASPSSGQTQ